MNMYQENEYYLFSLYTGIVGFGTRSREHVIKSLASEHWQGWCRSLGWYYIPKSYARFDGIRPVHDGWGCRVITTMEDLEYFDSLAKGEAT